MIPKMFLHTLAAAAVIAGLAGTLQVYTTPPAEEIQLAEQFDPTADREEDSHER
ncbi:hypothetical protein WCLP8_1910006 [uncultured Gammaproteobacteria bacterium]